MLQWTALKLPEAEQRILDLQRTTVTDSDIFYENPLSTQSEQSSNSSKTLSETDVDEGKGATRTRFSIISPRTMPKKLEKKENSAVQPESLYESIENYDTNNYVVSRELLDEFSKNSDDSDTIDPEIQDVLKSPPAEMSNKFKNKLKDLENVTLNIAVTGMTGAGKSSFVNSLRGLRSDHSDAAPTGTVETTLKPTMYLHPTMPNVKIWDLPGNGSPKFKAKKYLKDVKLSTYDFFLIVSSERFKENDIKLAKAIQENKKRFYFIRTKIDNDLRAEGHKRGFIEQRVLDKIREDCEKNLQKVGKPKVFLISSFQLEKFDFQSLVNTLEEELPKNKRFALIQSLPVYSTEALIKKKTYFKKMIWLHALAAGVGAIPPIPGLSVICDYGIMKNFFKQVFTGFSLSDDALQSLSERVNQPVDVLKAAKTSRFKDGVSEAILMDMLSKPIIAVTKTLGTVMALLPGGAFPAAGTAVASVHYLLNLGLNEMAEDTKNVLIAAKLAVQD
ncbi:interferon-gamma-inducible GTPase 10-like [Paramisgurnus dabryanus]|uniref:interferon-gamma-inducible GTPase 10-like n=1 Tax=Paramisgurnus dabryanus TaxID=90735 RepID=UPI0031F3F819